MTVIRLHNLSRSFAGGRSRRKVHAVQDVSLSLAQGETLALVGESGSGKSTLGRCAAMLTRPDAGEVWFRNTRIDQLSESELRPLRTQFQFVFQDALGALNPRMTLGAAIREPMIAHSICSLHEAANRVAELLEAVELGADYADRKPSALSGGELQRGAIARALAVDPALLILDEPFSALDVSVQAQLLDLLRRLKSDAGIASIVISHDLAVVSQLADRIAVMFAGRIVEIGSAKPVTGTPLHPYTKSLLAAIPSPDPALHATLASESLPERDSDAACAFFARCTHPARDETCRSRLPGLEPDVPHGAACHHVTPVRATSVE